MNDGPQAGRTALPQREARAGTFAATIAVAVLATGCTTIDPYTGEIRTARATQGALVGAAAGTLVGVLSSDSSRKRRKNAALAAGIGALAGGAIGHYMDQQEAELRRRLAGTGVSVSRYGDEIVLNMPGNITFASNEAAIDSEFFPVLGSVALVLEEYPRTLVEVTGHTDSTGGPGINETLSQRRADSVAAYLRSHGVLGSRIATQGLGSRYPVASNEDAAGRARNRRVELTLVPLTA